MNGEVGSVVRGMDDMDLVRGSFRFTADRLGTEGGGTGIMGVGE